MKTVYKNIKSLLGVTDGSVKLLRGKEMSSVNSIDNAYLAVSDGKIESFGKMDEFDERKFEGYHTEDLSGQFIMPAFADSHTHIVYAGSREIEYGDKIRGLSYEEIAKRGGGILNSADLLNRTSENELYDVSMQRLLQCVECGTGAIEIKSGYGLTTESELKMLRVIKKMKADAPITVKSTFLAHAFPRKYANRRDEYIRLITDEMIPAVAGEQLADYVDVFCDKGFFDVEQTARILEAAAKYGIIPKIHANELACSGGVQVGVSHNALSVDHLESCGEDEFKVLKDSNTMATLLPGAAFFLDISFAPARRMIDYGMAVALASDFNPGSSPSASMKFVLSLASIKMKMTPYEALNAATVNGAYAMGLSETHGQIAVGRKANFIITKPMPSFEYFSYSYTEPLIQKVIF